MDPDIEQYAKEMRHTATVAWLNYEIWWVYKSPETRPEYADTMNKYPLFFQTSLHAHFVALLMQLYHLYEKRKDTYNIPGFLKLLETRGAVDEATTIKLREAYEQIRPLWLKVCILRNNAFGHRSTAKTVDEIFAQANVTPNELRDLVEATKKILNTATQAVAGVTHAFNSSSREDTLNVLQKLKQRSDD